MDSEQYIESNVAILARESRSLTNSIIREKDPVKLEDLTALFKQNQLKKNLLRSVKLSTLQELLDDEAVARVTMAPEGISTKDLVSLINTTEQNLQHSINNYEQLPAIQIVNVDNSVNVNNSLCVESRKKIVDKVNEILASLSNNDNVIDVEEK